MISTVKKKEVLKKFGTNPKDTGSSRVQVAVLSERIKEITSHLSANKHDFMARRGLLQLVGRRKRLLKYIVKENSKDYLDLIKELGIRK